ncbi:uncharacterized protein At4g37920-like [Impatiens glandulifera]|uniref:uncharacterized protein At4g37920-like n=1 Tax=Impatiens glandulifera TaxID=253017 RepID=UPI001FB0A65E|nr:uncharacterized protein At4g37920-like [Impatiens glandulifera]XP_047323177.1 uncharacterized protein At4g37920-like [Impatiens glandulifera]
MELLPGLSSFSVRPPPPPIVSTSRNYPSSLPLHCNLSRLPSSANPKFKGCHFAKSTRQHLFLPQAVVSDTAKEQSDSIQEWEQQQQSSVGDGFTDEHSEITDSEVKDDTKMTRVCDKLIEVFMVDKPTSTDWRRLLAFSREWDNIRPHFYQRCLDRADSQSEPEMKHKLLRFARKLKEVDEDVQRHDELLAVLKNEPSDINEIVTRRRKDFTKEFFIHLHTVAESYYGNPTEQNTVAKLGNLCLAAIQAYDTASENIEALNAAELKFQDIINSPSLDVACRKIDDLAAKNQLDSALVLMITKAWSAAKESDLTKGEAKDILYHLYMTARGNLQRLMPKEIRILKYLLTVEDPQEQLSALRDAFTPGEELEGKDIDALYTTPETLYTWMKAVVNAYHFSKDGTLLREAKDLMNPKVIQRLEILQKLVVDNFM